jgi:hypothetical protein
VLPLEVWCRKTFRDEVNAVFEDQALCSAVGIHQATIGSPVEGL